VQVWRPPSLTPQYATALYVADKFGNWVLADERQKKRISRVELEGSSPVATNKGSNIPPKLPPSAPGPSRAGALRPAADIRRLEDRRRELPSMASRVHTSDIPGWKPSSPAPPVPSHPLLPRPVAARQPAAPRQRYSPVLNPFLDENGVSPVRSTIGSVRAPARAGARPARVGSPPGPPSPTLGGETPAHGRRSPPRTQTSQPRTRTSYSRPPGRSYSPVPAAAFRATPSQPPSLLAKRLGHEKAASLSLRESEGSRGSGRGSHGMGQLPSTPMWNPLLTPERRGDDLYLSLR
ncbi:hypothetical protein IMZ48_11425, partial [Candidatus Bathyarchaeota archaeon]|nr:hypothetical protein [Candidatus Bathyarchaeota archaeon]